VKREASPRKRRKGRAVAPVQGQKAARFAGRRVGNAPALDDDRLGPAIEAPMTPPPQIRTRMGLLVRNLA
jgi:hypothetical protein